MTSSGEFAVGVACDLLTEWTGIELKGSAPRRVDEFLRSRASQLGYPNKQEYLSHLGELDRSDPEPQRLINLVTNGLTMFWRDEPQLNAFASVVDEMSADMSSARPLQVWCAGCSTGEEAYTVAMIGEEHGVDVEVLGTDINTDYLRHARDADYDEWSLRRLSDQRRNRYFERGRGNDFKVVERLRNRVVFRRHNITMPAPRPRIGESWDVILCRNVLIYFAPVAFRRVLRSFGEALQENGYLLLGSSEQLLDDERAPDPMPFRAAQHGGGFVYRLASTPPGRTVHFGRHFSELGEESSGDVEDELVPPPALSMSSDGLDEVTSDVGQSAVVEHLFERALEHYSEQHIEAALASCEAATSYDPFVPETYCLMGFILARAGAHTQALDTYRKALFLDPFNWVAAIESARLYLDEGDANRARRALRQAKEGLDERPAPSAEMNKVLRTIDGSVTDHDSALALANEWLQRLRQ
jgi:chemotaxis protein methyltransferase CheR